MFGEKDDYNILTTGAGGIFSTVHDLFQWDQALYTEKLVQRETLNEAFLPTVLNNDSISYYGFGWRIINDESGTSVVHSGGLAGYRTFIRRYLDKKNTIVILTNKGNASQVGDISDAINNMLSNKPYELPKTPMAMKMYELIQEKGIEEAIVHYVGLKKNQKNLFDFSESQLNNLGYHLLAKKRIADAIKIFRLNVIEYPDAYNTYDSLGEAYMVNGEIELSIANYNKSLELNPENINAVKMLKKIRQQMISDKN